MHVNHKPLLMVLFGIPRGPLVSCLPGHDLSVPQGRLGLPASVYGLRGAATPSSAFISATKGKYQYVEIVERAAQPRPARPGEGVCGAAAWRGARARVGAGAWGAPRWAFKCGSFRSGLIQKNWNGTTAVRGNEGQGNTQGSGQEAASLPAAPRPQRPPGPRAGLWAPGPRAARPADGGHRGAQRLAAAERVRRRWPAPQNAGEGLHKGYKGGTTYSHDS